MGTNYLLPWNMSSLCTASHILGETYIFLLIYSSFIYLYLILVSFVSVMYIRLPDDHSLMNDSNTALGVNHVCSNQENDTDSMIDAVSLSTENSEASNLSTSVITVNTKQMTLSSIAKSRPKRKTNRNNALRHYKKRKKKAKMKHQLRAKQISSSLAYRDRGNNVIALVLFVSYISETRNVKYVKY